MIIHPVPFSLPLMTSPNIIPKIVHPSSPRWNHEFCLWLNQTDNAFIHTFYFSDSSISFVFHFVTTFMKQLSLFWTVLHLNIDIACVHASPKELVPNGLRVDVALLIHLPPLIIVLLSVVVVPSGENLKSPPIWKIIFENNQLFWLQHLAMLGSTGTPTVWQDQNFKKYQCQIFLEANFFADITPSPKF